MGKGRLKIWGEESLINDWAGSRRRQETGLSKREILLHCNREEGEKLGGIEKGSDSMDV